MENNNLENKKTLQNNPEYFDKISKLFNNCGVVAPIIEKAYRNFELKRKNEKNKKQRIHYFAIGHAFKQVDIKTVFEYVLDEDNQKELPTKFLALQINNFDFEEKLYNLIGKIRNINNHYIHKFDEIDQNKIDKKIILFLRESFELAIIQTYFKEKRILPTSDIEIIDFIKRIFNLDKKFVSKDDVINTVLFFSVETDFVWNMNLEHEVLDIKKGTYLTFEACLFLVTMFLYKNEANHLIPKINGYKRADGDEMKSKRYLFSYFSKKFTSQDVDTEETHLVKFRDLIQYLNHFPSVWNKDLELEAENKNLVMTLKLEEEIINMEINRSYPDFKIDNNFLIFAKGYLSSEKNRNKLALKNIENKFTPDEQGYYNEITFDPHIKIFKKEIEKAVKPIAFNIIENPYKIFIKKYVLKTYFPDKDGYNSFRNFEFKYDKKLMKMSDDGFEEKIMINNNTEKLKLRIAKNLLIKSYGRNQDRFMDFAIRFLAEKKYFGEDVQFKCYQFYNTIEQDEYLDKFDKIKDKKIVDDLKYHRGKLVHFITYADKKIDYPEWEFPYVEENNAISIKINLNNEVKIIPIQRALMVYFIEHALYLDKVEGKGKGLLLNYYLNCYKKDFASKLETLEQFDENTSFDKTSFKKLMPRRLLNQYVPALQNNLPDRNSLELILDKALNQEKRYANLLQKTKDTEQKYKSTHKNDASVTLVEDFTKRNKGKQFKLQFIRKTCKLMFFKQTYNAQIGADGHHKRFNITKEEFDDFSRWMFAYNGNDSYKKYLTELFEKKGFFLNPDFKRIFGESQDLNSLYEKVKKEYSKWLINPSAALIDEKKHKLDNYRKFFINNTFYINLSHFISYLKSKNILNVENEIIQYKALQNTNYLIGNYYYKDKIEANDYKTRGKLYNKLKKIKLEDALLYEIAFSYLQNPKDIAKANVTEILTQNLVFGINDAEGNHSYNLTVPFNKIDSYVELVSEKHSKNSSLILTNLQKYLQKTRVKKGKDANGRNVFMENDLNFEDLNTINNTIINEALKFTKVLMGLEEYFILKDKTKMLPDKNFIENNDIVSLHKFSEVWKIWKEGNTNADDPDVNFRNIACHFNLPLEKSLETVLKEIEVKFLKNEINTKPLDFDSLSKNIKRICELFLQNIHNDFYINLFKKEENSSIKNDKKEKIKRVNKKYLEEIINQSLV